MTPLPEPQIAAETVRDWALAHHKWRGSCINLIPSENIASPAVREMMVTDFANRYAEGKPFERYYCGTRFIDHIETLANDMAKELFRAEHANVLPLSGSQANFAVFYALTAPGDTVMTLDVPSGGHISYMKWGGAGARGLKVEKIPFNPKDMIVDIDALSTALRRVKPKLVLFGGSVILFPQPVKEARAVADEYGGFVGFDSAHVLCLLIDGIFQDPLREGADIVSSSTHKTFPGPQGGIIFSKANLVEKIDRAVFPGIVSNHHLHRLAALAIALAEMRMFGSRYAHQIVRNAKALARALHEAGLDVLCSHKDFTQTHQVLINVASIGGGRTVAELLEQANIICNKNLMYMDEVKNSRNPSGIRLGTQEVTRLGMKESEMKDIAEFISTIAIKKANPETVAAEVAAYMKNFDTVKYTFNEGKAYTYPELH